MRGSLTAQKINSLGRTGFHLIDDQPTANYPIQEFVKKLCSTHYKSSWLITLLKNWIAIKLWYQVKAASQIGLKDDFFRSRAFSCGCLKPHSECMGPPPLYKQKEGRYTEGKDVVLYLSRNPKTAAIESNDSHGKSTIYIQKFSLDLPNIRFLSLTSSLEEKYPHLHYLLLNSEYKKEESSHHLVNPYRATQFIAFLCRLRGVNAVEYPSVSGYSERNPDAINLVVFGQFVNKATKMMDGEPYQYDTN